ncbi:MAG: hybrid sensor histidine kinase/response regulator, partial [Parasporobacterium sp.]|nr:hybrid sensor histidine kinase/response regulator [Parasporobacterium sp.]
MKRAKIKLLTTFVIAASISTVGSIGVLADENNDSFISADENSGKVGGGYAVTGEIENIGYTAEVYDALNGLPTSDANYILGAKNGYVWVGGYSGVFKYDGSNFEKLPSSDGFTSARGLFEDSRGRIWVGTNDNGVVVLDGEQIKHFTYKDGLASSSIRTFAEDNNGNVFIGTTAGIAYVDSNLEFHVFDDSRLN